MLGAVMTDSGGVWRYRVARIVVHPSDGVDEMTPPTPDYAKWERLKRLTYIVDSQVGKGRITGPSLSDPDSNGVRYISSGATTQELDEVHQLVYELGLVSPEHNWMDHEFQGRPDVRELDLGSTGLLLTGIFRGDRFIDGLLVAKVREGLVQDLCRHAYALTLNVDGWPSHLPVLADGTLRTGIVVRSLSGRLEGRTTGGRRDCPSRKCNGWLIGVHWCDGQRLHICSEGWHYDPLADEIHVVGGGEISARFVSPKPLGRDPRPKNEWPARATLLKSRAWSTATDSRKRQ